MLYSYYKTAQKTQLGSGVTFTDEAQIALFKDTVRTAQ
jgi:hypothetical protein